MLRALVAPRGILVYNILATLLLSCFIVSSEQLPKNVSHLYKKTGTKRGFHTNLPKVSVHKEMRCEEFVPGFTTPPSFYKVNRTRLIQMLSNHTYSVAGSRRVRSPLDVPLFNNVVLPCSTGPSSVSDFSDSEIKPFIALARPFQNCTGIIATANFGGKDHLHQVPEYVLSDNSSSAAGAAGRRTSTGSRPPDAVCFIAFIDGITLERVLRHSNGTSAAFVSVYKGWNLLYVKGDPGGTARRRSRIPKLLLPRLFPSAAWSLWIDSKIKIWRSPAESVTEHLYAFGSFMSLFNHFERATWAEEAEEAVRQGLQHRDGQQGQQAAYAAAGFPRDYPGLLEGSIIMRDHRHVLTHVASCLWWNEYERFPPRDQTSLPYVAWMLGFQSAVSLPDMKKVRRTMGAKQFQKLWYNMESPSLTRAVLHVAPNCRKYYHYKLVGHVVASTVHQ